MLVSYLGSLTELIETKKITIDFHFDFTKVVRTKSDLPEPVDYNINPIRTKMAENYDHWYRR